MTDKVLVKWRALVDSVIMVPPGGYFFLNTNRSLGSKSSFLASDSSLA